jgi:serine protease Do
MAKNIMQQLKEFGKVTRGWLGVMIQHVTPELADNFGLDRPIGALVGQVVPESPAEKSGIKPGDVIIEYNGKEVSQMSMLPAMVAQTPIDEQVEVVLIREGKKKTIPVTIGKMAEEQALFDSDESVGGLELGLTVQELSPELADSLGIEDVSGLIVTNVDGDSAAAEAGINRGDIIQEINREQVSSIAEYKKALLQAKNKNSILLLVKRDQHTRFVVIKLK